MKRLQFIKIIGGFFSGSLMLTRVLYNRHLTRKKTWILYEGWISGCAYYEASDVVEDLVQGQTLELRREPQNKYDKNAIEIYAGEAKLGYIAQMDNTVLAAMMDHREPISAEVAKVNAGGRV